MQRIEYRGSLTFPYGFHSGDGGSWGAVDQPLLRTFSGGVELLGTSLAGVLRSDLHRLAESLWPSAGRCRNHPRCKCPVCLLMGPYAQRQRNQDGENFMHASRLEVRGGVAEKEPSIRIRDRVGIDRRRRTAADQRKYDLEVTGPITFPFTLGLDLSPTQLDELEPSLRLLEISLRRLGQGWLFLGGKTSSGLGRAEIRSLQRHVIDLNDAERLVALLLDDGPPVAPEPTELTAGVEKGWRPLPTLDSYVDGKTDPAAEEVPAEEEPAATGAAEAQPWAQLKLDMAVHFPFGLLVNDPAESVLEGFAHAYLRLQDGRPVLPGSSLKGALRSRAEQILRTFGGVGVACDLHTKGEACHERIQQENKKRGKAMEHPEELAHLCLACRVFGSGRLASSVRVTDALPVAGQELGTAHGQDFVAIDRFTGGAAPGLKFDAQSSPTVTLAGELHVDVGPGRLEDWGLGLLLLTLRDWLEDDLPLGFGTAKGLNEHHVRFPKVAAFWVRPPAALQTLLDALPEAEAPPVATVDLELKTAADEALSPLANLVPPAQQQALQGWVAALHRRITSYVSPFSGEPSHDDA